MRLGVFDSGIGGITVLRELRKELPGHDYVYLGDTAHVPYGTKSAAQIERFSVDCASVLRSKGIDALIVACNTASSLALSRIRETLEPIPVFGVVEPGVEAVVDRVRELGPSEVSPPVVLVLATRATVASGAYGKGIRGAIRNIQVIEQACPLLVPMIEEGWIDHPILHQTIRAYVEPHLRTTSPGIALLGCTHYPWIQTAFESAMPGWTIVNSAQAVTRAVARALGARTVMGSPAVEPKIEWIFTDPHSVPAFARHFIDESRTSNSNSGGE